MTDLDYLVAALLGAALATAVWTLTDDCALTAAGAKSICWRW